MVVAASYRGLKNMAGVAKAMLHLKSSPCPPDVLVGWYGGIRGDQAAYNEVRRFIAERGLSGCLRLLPETRSIEKEFAGASAVGLFSFFEGLPNTVCEGMACGKPILMSDVCDAGNLVREGKNGFLCDPYSPESIAGAFRRLAAMSEQGRREMGLESRRMAETLFAPEVVAGSYERVLAAAAAHRAIPPDCTWPPEAPQSARRTVEDWRRRGRIGGRAWARSILG